MTLLTDSPRIGQKLTSIGVLAMRSSRVEPTALASHINRVCGAYGGLVHRKGLLECLTSRGLASPAEGMRDAGDQIPTSVFVVFASVNLA